jgi:hypothetical protein
MPEETDQFVVARFNDGQLWYWGSWPDKKSAEKVAKKFDNGIVVENID